MKIYIVTLARLLCYLVYACFILDNCIIIRIKYYVYQGSKMLNACKHTSLGFFVIFLS